MDEEDIEKEIAEDIEGVYEIANKVPIPRKRAELFNRLSALPHSKERIKRGLKQRMRFLAQLYISLSASIEDEDVEHFRDYPDTERSKMILQRMIENMDQYTEEMRAFKLIEDEARSAEEAKEEMPKMGF